MGRTEQIRLLSHQLKFVQSRKRHTALVAGYGGGKSYAGTVQTVLRKLENPLYSVGYYLPSYGLIRDIAFGNFSNVLDLLGLKYTLNKSDKEIIIPGSGRIIFRSMDNPESIIGYETAFSCVDECDVLPQQKMSDAFVKIIARNRSESKDGINSTNFVSSPEGFKWLYNFFVKEDNNSKMLIHAKTTDNPFLPAGYVDGMKDSYSPAQLSAYLNGEFVNLTSGSVYSEFDRKKCHTNRSIKTGEVLHIGMDFNITNMSAVVHVIEDGLYYAVEEITGAYDTNSMIRIIQDRYENHKIVIYPDASGKNRSTSGKSDVQLLQEVKFLVRAHSKNPFVRDRVNAMNTAFRKGLYKVNSFNCPEYAEALEKIAYDKNEPDKQSGFDHITDAGGYFIYIISKVSFTL